MTVVHEYHATFYTKQNVLARVCQSVDTSQFFKVMSSRGETCLPLGHKQHSVRRRKVRPRSSKLFGKASSEETSPPVVAPTATVKKPALPKPQSSSMDIAVSPLVTDGPSTDSICEMNGLRLIDLGDLLASVTRRTNCNVCGSGMTVRESLKNRRGLCTKLTLSCTNPLCAGVDDAFSDPYKHAKALNTRFILAGRMCGKGSAGLETICGVMGLPPPVFPKCFSEHNLVIHKIATEVCEDSFKSASAQLRALHGAGPDDDVVDCTVTCDGPWSRRGFVANYGVVAVVSWETGQVLDVVVLSKSCKVCKEVRNNMGSESTEFLEWMVKHQDYFYVLGRSG